MRINAHYWFWARLWLRCKMHIQNNKILERLPVVLKCDYLGNCDLDKNSGFSIGILVMLTFFKNSASICFFKNVIRILVKSM